MAEKSTKSQKKKSSRNGLFVCLWLIFAIILLIVFLVNKEKFISNLKASNFFERIVGTTPEFISSYKEKEQPKESNGLLDVEVKPVPGPTETASKNNTESSLPETKQQPNTSIEEKQETVSDTPYTKQKEEQTVKNEKPNKNNDAQKEKPTNVPTRNAKLYFVLVDSDGTVSRKQITRSISKSDSPLTDTIKALLTGPTSSEKGCMSLIPEGTQLLSATVKDGIAALNFNENFEFNAIGADGYRAQLMQIVYTATEFSTVESVQFLIDGKRKDYIGSGEDMWMWVGSPYSRSSFN